MMTRRILLLASYCSNNKHCTENRPCVDCLAMCNVYEISSDQSVGKYVETLEYLEDQEKLLEGSKKLWSILDDIDTSSDRFKPEINNPDSMFKFYTHAMKVIKRRFKIFKSDGYNLTLKK